jgi:hypothetical protein
VTVPVQLHERLLRDDRAASFATGDGWTLHRRDDGAWAFSMPEQRPHGDVLWRLHTRPPFLDWSLEVNAAAGHTAPPLANLVQYPLDQLLLTHTLYADHGVLLHAAAAILHGRALVFPGVSGAGKSTLMRLLSADADFLGLSDDRVVLQRSEHGFQAHGTPWAGDARIARADDGPLAALCFIEPAASVDIQPLSAEQALARLLPVTTLAWYDAAVLEMGLTVVEALLQQHPAVRLGVPLDGAALCTALRDAFPAND